MQHLFQSTFLQALGYAIANSLWQTALVWLIYTGITGLVSMNAAARYRLAVMTQVTGFIWFVFTFRFYYRQYHLHGQQTGLLQGTDNLVPVTNGSSSFTTLIAQWMVKGEQLLPYISMAYLLLIVFLCIRWIIGFQQTQQIRNKGLQKMPVSYRLFVTRVATQLGIKQKIRLFLSDTVSSPLTIGFLKPVILVPLASINHLSTDQLEAVLLHELAHIKRYDYLVNILLSVVEISLFFNPFTQLLSKSIRKERENSCDDWVLQFKYNATVYAEALLRIAYLQATPAFAMAATGKQNELLVRVKRMIEQKENRFSYRRQLLAFVIVTGIMSSIAWLNPITTTHQDEASHTLALKNKSALPEQPSTVIAAEPKAAPAENPMFNPMFFLSKPLKAEISQNLASAQKEITTTISKQVTETVPKLVSSLTPLISGALEQAAHSVSAAAIPAMNNAINELKNTKLKLGDISSLKDSLQNLPSIRIHFEDEINQSFKKAAEEIKKAAKEVNRNADRSENTSQKKNKEIAEQDVQKAILILQQLDKIGFDQMIHEMITVPVAFTPSGSIPFQKLTTAFRYRFDDHKKKNDTEQKDDNRLAEKDPATMDVDAASAEATMQPVEELVQLPEMIGYSTPVAATVRKIKIDPATFIKLVYLKQAALEKLRVSAFRNREKQHDDAIIIQLQ
jgi:beta-lactamase regulating signal transducer with metallopeptidase domain